jgi:hypothetical protein
MANAARRTEAAAMFSSSQPPATCYVASRDHPGYLHDVGPDPTLSDVRREPVGNFVGRVDPDDPVGSFASVPRLRRQGAGAFAGHPDRQRQGSFGDHDLGHAA